MFADLDNPAFQDDDTAREWLESCIWPDGPKCPHCGSFGEGVTRMQGKAHRPLHPNSVAAMQQAIAAGGIQLLFDDAGEAAGIIRQGAVVVL
jgi:hypothetical protein